MSTNFWSRRSPAAFNRLTAIQSAPGARSPISARSFSCPRQQDLVYALFSTVRCCEQMLGHTINTSLTNAPQDSPQRGRIAL